MKCLRRELIYFISLSALAENFTIRYVVFHRLHSKQFHGAVDVWKRNFNHVEHLFDYGSAVRKVMCTTNAVEIINLSFRKVTKKGAFPNEMHYSNCSIYAQPSFTKSGMAVRFKIGLWSEINWLRMKKSVPVLKNTST